MVVACQKGLKLSQGVASLLRAAGADVESLEGGQVSHLGDKCSIDTMLDMFGLKTEALSRLALVVRAADTDRLDLAPQARPAPPR